MIGILPLLALGAAAFMLSSSSSSSSSAPDAPVFDLANASPFKVTAGDYRRAGREVPENPYYAKRVDVGPVKLNISTGVSRANMPDDALVFWSDKYSTIVAAQTDVLTHASRTVDQWGRNVAGEGSSLDQLVKAVAASDVGDALAAVRSVLRTVTDSPLWSLAASGASLIPGVGTAVSVGMSVAYAYGHGIAVSDAALAAARAAVPGGALGQAAFDVGVALANGEGVSAAAVSAARAQLPEGPARAAFDVGLAKARGRPVSQATREAAAEQAAALLA